MPGIDFRLDLMISILYRFRKCFMNRQLSEYGSAGIFPLLLLLVEQKEGLNQEQIADLLKVDKGAIARSVKKLEQEGYLRRHEAPEDKRAYEIYLEPKAIEMLPKIHDSIEAWDERILRGISEEDRRIFADCLQRMAQNAYACTCESYQD